MSTPTTKKIKKNESITKAEATFKFTPALLIVLGLWSIYMYLTLISPDTSSKQYNISKETLTILRISIALPFLISWMAAAFSFIKIKRYAEAIAPSKESVAFHNISNGIVVMLIGLILSTFLSTLKNIFIDSQSLRSIFTILTNYAYIYPYLIAFILLLSGARSLARGLKDYRFPLKKVLIYDAPFLLFAYVWLELIFTNPTRLVAGSASKFATYYLKDSVLILTIIIPALITWLLGFFAVIKLRIYYKYVAGILYKRALGALVYGFTCVILASIFLQSLLSLGSERLLNLGLGKLLIVIYLFLITQTIGFLLTARGANNLTKIEAV